MRIKKIETEVIEAECFECGEVVDRTDYENGTADCPICGGDLMLNWTTESLECSKCHCICDTSEKFYEIENQSIYLCKECVTELRNSLLEIEID